MNKKYLLIGIGSLLAIDFIIAKLNKSPKIIHKQKLPFNFNAQSLPPFVIKIQREDEQNTILMQHELVHWEQYRRTGAILFYLRYGLEKIVFGYDKMPLEVEARREVGETEYCQNNYTECVRNGKSVTVKDVDFRV